MVNESSLLRRHKKKSIGCKLWNLLSQSGWKFFYRSCVEKWWDNDGGNRFGSKENGSSVPGGLTLTGVHRPQECRIKSVSSILLGKLVIRLVQLWNEFWRLQEDNLILDFRNGTGSLGYTRREGICWINWSRRSKWGQFCLARETMRHSSHSCRGGHPKMGLPGRRI